VMLATILVAAAAPAPVGITRAQTAALGAALGTRPAPRHRGRAT
jgi:hypothetical protein